MNKLIALSLLATFAIVAGQSCSDAEDPRRLKRDPGNGPVVIYRVQWNGRGLDGKLIAIDSSSHPLKNALYEGDAYVIEYAERKGRKPDVIYFWQGAKSSNFEKGGSAILAVKQDDLIGGIAEQKRVVMNSEPSHFLRMFNGTLVTLAGGIERTTVDQDTDGVMLFRVRSGCNSAGNKETLTKTNQVPETQASIVDTDSFVLKTPKGVFIYDGPGSSPEEKVTAEKVAISLFPRDAPKKVSKKTLTTLI